MGEWNVEIREGGGKREKELVSVWLENGKLGIVLKKGNIVIGVRLLFFS